jgi:hypothetical protein
MMSLRDSRNRLQSGYYNNWAKPPINSRSPLLSRPPQTAVTLAVFRPWRTIAVRGFGGRHCRRRSLSVTLGHFVRLVKSKAIIWRMVVEILIVLTIFSPVDMMTSPSESTVAAVTEAVNKKQLEPSCMVEVRSAVRSAGFMSVALFVVTVATIFLFCSDAWALWQSRRKV